jgi:hypothetical protein
MEFVPFGQDSIPPTAGKATKCRMVYNSMEFLYTKGIEAFKLLFNLLTLKQTKGGHGLHRFF